ncbi:hypothetical protein JOE68_004739 [Saccharothrix algeriensis]|uniref:Uncharacterized protein n=1 Tax=Saccharothrix algeriensis TaxID=173560 RepID=A0ABS2SD20_9PSEU|nr:hypothetical protein [Saccharothrix algeriensis]
MRTPRSRVVLPGDRADAEPTTGFTAARPAGR